MDNTMVAENGMVVAPHHLATQSGLAVLREGGTAMEAVVAAAATIAVVYPHMNGIGGDSFWLIVPPQGDPIVIEACGAAGSLATPEFYKGDDNIPFYGPKGANTVAGTVGGWQEALNYASECGHTTMPVSRLLSDAIMYAEQGFPMSSSQELDTIDEIKDRSFSKYFKNVFVPNDKVIKAGEKFVQKNLAETLKYLSKNGLGSFYKGELTKLIANDMKNLGMPITESDLENYKAERKTPLSLLHKHGEIYNLPPPTQGLASLCILGILDKLNISGEHEGEFIHAIVEATKQAFTDRNQHITDPFYMTIDPKTLLTNDRISKLAAAIDLNKAGSFNGSRGPGDTVWLGAMDNKGYSISFIQSIYHSFGSGVLLPSTGILWHNRGVSFSLDPNHILALKPGKKPFHTLNPAAAKLTDGRVMMYGTKGGDGQPQIQAAIFHKYVIQGFSLQKSISSPRWLYGKETGKEDDRLKLESRISMETERYLKEKGHDVVMIEPYCASVGQAGALVRYPNGMMEGAYDPRSDGSAAGF